MEEIEFKQAFNEYIKSNDIISPSEFEQDIILDDKMIKFVLNEDQNNGNAD